MAEIYDVTATIANKSFLYIRNKCLDKKDYVTSWYLIQRESNNNGEYGPLNLYSIP